MKKITILLFMVIFIVSCHSFEVNLKGNPKNLKILKKSALLEIIILPIGDCGYSPIYNKYPGTARYNAREISNEIDSLNIFKVDTYEKYLGSELNENFDFHTIFGDSLRETEQYKSLTRLVNVYQDTIDNEVFGKVFIPAVSLNFIDFMNDNIISDFNKYKQWKSTYSKIAVALDVDCLILAYTQVIQTQDSDPFYDITSKAGTVGLIFIDRSGDVILAVNSASNDEICSDDKILIYEECLDTYYQLVDNSINKILGREIQEVNVGNANSNKQKRDRRRNRYK
jgi:hypothetical protein